MVKATSSLVGVNSAPLFCQQSERERETEDSNRVEQPRRIRRCYTETLHKVKIKGDVGDARQGKTRPRDTEPNHERLHMVLSRCSQQVEGVGPCTFCSRMCIAQSMKSCTGQRVGAMTAGQQLQILKR